MSKEAMTLALEALEYIDNYMRLPAPATKAITALRQALANDALDKMADNARELGLDYEPAQQEPVAWNVINPAGKVVATEKDAIHGWARLGGFKPTLEGLLGFHDQGWRVVPAAPQPAQQQEPFAMKTHGAWDGLELLDEMPDGACLYTSPQPSKPWVGLTDEEIIDHFRTNVGTGSLLSFADGVRYAEAKLREKNT